MDVKTVVGTLVNDMPAVMHFAFQATLDLQPDRLWLEVRDDGLGFDVPSALAPDTRQDHLGLVSMARRAKEFRGELCVESKPGQGTQVFLEIPFPPTICSGGPFPTPSAY